MQTFEVTAKGRLDTFLAQIAGVSRVHAGEIIRDGCVMVNTRRVHKPAHIVDVGDTVEASIEGLPASESHIASIDLHMSVLYEDDACLVINKPAMIAVHPAIGIGKDEPTILHGIAHLFAERKIPFVASHVLAHRLDRETTGCLLIAKTPEAHRALQKQFADRKTQKTYLTIVAGVPRPAAALIDAPIGRSTVHRTRMAVHQASATRSATTTYRTLSRSDDAALLACDLHTGRTHQLRVHLSTIGHPILGDPTYSTRATEKMTAEHSIAGLCLHAWKITFTSPATNDLQTVTAPPPELFLNACKACGLNLSTAA